MQHEFRYLVLKQTDIANALSENEIETLKHLTLKIALKRIELGKKLLNGVFVEDDWPEHDIVWEMIARRVDNTQ